MPEHGSDSERPSPRPETLARLKLLYIGLLVGGLLAGGALAWGVIAMMERAGLTDAGPAAERRQQR